MNDLLEELKIKFIIIDDNFIYGKVRYHRDLIPDELKDKPVKGGGIIDFNDGKSFTLYGSSDEFGSCKKEDIVNCFLYQKIYYTSLMMDVNKKYTFYYRGQNDIVNLNYIKVSIDSYPISDRYCSIGDEAYIDVRNKQISVNGIFFNFDDRWKVNVN